MRERRMVVLEAMSIVIRENLISFWMVKSIAGQE